MDMVAHCGKSVSGSHAHSLVITDIASGWTEAAALIVREQTLITATLENIRWQLPFPMLGLDADNDSAFSALDAVHVLSRIREAQRNLS